MNMADSNKKSNNNKTKNQTFSFRGIAGTAGATEAVRHTHRNTVIVENLPQTLHTTTNIG